MATALAHEMMAGGSRHLLAQLGPDTPYDPRRVCSHSPAQTYTREACSCGRSLYPPRGRGRGESLLSPRRMRAKERALEAMRLHIADGYTFPQIAARLGYRTPSGAWRAVQRLRDHEAAWRSYYARMGRAEWYDLQRALWRLQRASDAEQEDAVSTEVGTAKGGRFSGLVSGQSSPIRAARNIPRNNCA